MKIFNHLKYIGVFTLIGVLAVACSEKNDISRVPEITSIEFRDPPKELIVEFTDGDGNFGIEDGEDKFSEFLDDDSTMINPYYENLWVDYYELRNEEWVFIEPNNSFGYRVPPLDPDGQSDLLEVKFTIDLGFDLVEIAESDTVKFKVTVVDRDLNESVPMETDTIILSR